MKYKYLKILRELVISYYLNRVTYFFLSKLNIVEIFLKFDMRRRKYLQVSYFLSQIIHFLTVLIHSLLMDK